MEVSQTELTVDEVGMLNWFKEFPGRACVVDATVRRLLAKGLLTIEDATIGISSTGLSWLEAADACPDAAILATIGVFTPMTAGQSVMNKSVEYAVAALVQLAAERTNEPLSNKLICERTGMPERFVLQILRELVRAGIVISTRGVQGGYRLVKPAHQVSLLEICEAIGGPLASPSVDAKGLTAVSQKLLDGTLTGVANDARRHLSAFTLDKLKATKE